MVTSTEARLSSLRPVHVLIESSTSIADVEMDGVFVVTTLVSGDEAFMIIP